MFSFRGKQPAAAADRNIYGHRAYFEKGFGEVDGWLHENFGVVLDLIADLHEDMGIAGPSAEIGVHHGKFFIPLHNMMRPGEKSVAMDIFGDQSQNPDQSGHGAKDVFLQNVRKFGRAPEDVACIQANSLLIEAAQQAEIEVQYGKFRLFSIDGSHTAQHTFHDFQTAMSLLQWGGVIFVDDYYSPHWPGVHEAINRHYALGTPKVSPFLFAYNKMMFTTYDRREAFYEKARTALKGLDYYKEVVNFGFPCITL